MKRFIYLFVFIVLICGLRCDAAFWNKTHNNQPNQQLQRQSKQIQAKNEAQAIEEETQKQNSQNSTGETSYPDDVDGMPISGEEYQQDIDIEQIYRDMPVPEFSYMHDIDPGEYQDTRYSTWSPYPLFRLTAPLFFKTVAIEPGYYLLTPREHKGKWYILFKEAGKVKYIIPCYNREMVPVNFYKNNLPQVKLTTPQKIREVTLKLVGQRDKASKRKPIPDTYLDAEDLDNNFISIVVYWGNYRYYMVLRSIRL